MSEKLDVIIERIRRPIIQGTCAPGSRLPNRSHMVETYGASSATIQHAIRTLKRDGFVSTRGKNGTFVHPRPPHLFRYGMVYSTYIQPSFFTRSFDHVSRMLGAGDDITFEMYRPVTMSFDKGEYQRLLDDVRAHRLAGIVFITTPQHAFAGSDVLTQRGIPRVFIGSPMEQCDGMPRVVLNEEPFCEAALGYLASRGRSRIARLQLAAATDKPADFAQRIEAAGMRTKPIWSQAVCHEPPSVARNVTHLLFSPDLTERPDTLMVMDDNLVDAAVLGLADAGLRVPDDVDVVALANFPLLPNTAAPVHYMAYDIERALRTALGMLERIRRAKHVVDITITPEPVDEIREERKRYHHESAGAGNESSEARSKTERQVSGQDTVIGAPPDHKQTVQVRTA